PLLLRPSVNAPSLGRDADEHASAVRLVLAPPNQALVDQRRYHSGHRCRADHLSICPGRDRDRTATVDDGKRAQPLRCHARRQFHVTKLPGEPREALVEQLGYLPGTHVAVCLYGHEALTSCFFAQALNLVILLILCAFGIDSHTPGPRFRRKDRENNVGRMFSPFERRISPFSINRIRKAKLREPLRKYARILRVGVLKAELPVERVVDAEADLPALRRQSHTEREIREPEAVRAELGL